MGKAKSRHDMDTAGVRDEIISLCIFTELQLMDTPLFAIELDTLELYTYL